MAATFAFRASGVGSFQPVTPPGSFFDALVEVTGDGSYPTGGYPFGVTQLQAMSGGAYSAIESVEVVNPWTSGTQGAVAAYNKTTGKIQAFGGTPASGTIPESAAASVFTSMVCTLRVRFY